MFLRGLLSILRSERTFEVVASCCDGMESLQAIRDLPPDITLLNSSIPLLSGVEVLARVISERSPTRISSSRRRQRYHRFSPSPTVPTAWFPQIYDLTCWCVACRKSRPVNACRHVLSAR